MNSVQDIFRLYGDAFLAQYGDRLDPSQWKAYHAILDCRTAKLGGHVDVCDVCDFKRISYNSCRNRHCPQCQGLESALWVERQEQYLLNVEYFHGVFTVPSELYPAIFHQPSLAYDLLFKAVAETILELCKPQKKGREYLGATPGIIAVLHTWGQNLAFHPHIHVIVTGGGLFAGCRWVPSGHPGFLLPVRVMAKKFRGKLLSFFTEAGIKFDKKLYKKDWVVYCKPSFPGAKAVLKYLGRYTHRVAIGNSRIISIAGGRIKFWYKDYRDDNKQKIMTLDAVEFIRRFMMHILPSGFHKIRQYGILASRDKHERMRLCQRLTRTPPPPPPRTKDDIHDYLEEYLGHPVCECPKCGIGHLSRASPDVENSIMHVV